MVESVKPLFEEPSVREEVTIFRVTFVPHALNVGKIAIKVVFDDSGTCFRGSITSNEAFSEYVQRLVVLVFEAAFSDCFDELFCIVVWSVLLDSVPNGVVSRRP